MSDERKYRQRGYQDSERGSERGASRGAGRDQPPPEKKDGPRGRGLGAPTASVFRCAACGEKRASGSGITLETLCGRCGAPLHSCSNCIHFDTASRWECRRHAELQARVAKKTAANACTLFTPKVTQEFGQESEKPLDPRAAFDALFKR